MPIAPAASVRIGGYSLEVGTQNGSFAQFEPEQETTNAPLLKAALAEAPEERQTAVAAVEEFQESAAAVTNRIQQADDLLSAAASGQLGDLGNVTGEVSTLLDLLGRLDRAGRFEEELRLMRSLNGLLVLAKRWYDLVRSLRSLLESARAAGHIAGQAWAHHELGSLHLCAGESESASRHLREALRIEEQLGDLAGRCATRHNLDSAQRDLALRAGGRLPRRLLRLVGLAAVLLAIGGGVAGIAFAIRDGGDGGGTTGEHTSATLTVKKSFSDGSRAAVTVSVSCTNGGTTDQASKPASEASAAVFTISGFSAGATCTATEEKPSGYTSDERACQRVSITNGQSSSCTITNTLSSVQLTVGVTFSDKNPKPVTVSVSCTNGGTPAPASQPASEASAAAFTISGFSAGATCTATEGATGYNKDESGCKAVPLDALRRECTIVNTAKALNSATLTVKKSFSDGSRAAVTVSVSCTNGGTTDQASKPASEASAAVFTISGFSAGATCTATEEKPSGYTSDERACQRVSITNGQSSSCTITNTLSSVQLTVGVTFSDKNPKPVTVSVSCTNGGTPAPASQPASEASAAAFTISGFSAGATCTATEGATGYNKDESGCKAVPLDALRRECTIVNTVEG